MDMLKHRMLIVRKQEANWPLMTLVQRKMVMRCAKRLANMNI